MMVLVQINLVQTIYHCITRVIPCLDSDCIMAVIYLDHCKLGNLSQAAHVFSI